MGNGRVLWFRDSDSSDPTVWRLTFVYLRFNCAWFSIVNTRHRPIMHSTVQMTKHTFHRLAKTEEERPDYLERVGGEVWENEDLGLAQQLSQSVTLSAESLSINPRKICKSTHARLSTSNPTWHLSVLRDSLQPRSNARPRNSPHNRRAQPMGSSKARRRS